jgi:hypothetical protein
MTLLEYGDEGSYQMNKSGKEKIIQMKKSVIFFQAFSYLKSIRDNIPCHENNRWNLY